jgi:sulfur carrier protein
MQVLLNGTPHTLERALTVAELIASLDTGAHRIAVERNGEIVPRSRHGEVRLADGDRIEIVVAVGGG